MTNAQFLADVERDLRAIIREHSAPAVVRERCAFCGGFGRCAVPVVGAILWPTRTCAACGGSGAVVVEA